MCNYIEIPAVEGIKPIKMVINEGDILVFKIDTDKYDVATAAKFLEHIYESLPNNIPVLGIPTGIDVIQMNKEQIIEMIESVRAL